MLHFLIQDRFSGVFYVELALSSDLPAELSAPAFRVLVDRTRGHAFNERHYCDRPAYEGKLKPKEIIRAIEQDGWVLSGVRGSHHIYTHPAKPGRVVVPYHNKEMGKGMENAILKQAGLK